jgi:hypothetical protein
MCLPGVVEAGWVVDPGDPSPSTTGSRRGDTVNHKVLTYVEYRAVSGVFQNIYPHPPFHPASVSSPRTKGGEAHNRRAVMAVGGQYFGRRQTKDWPLTV